jgi:hypothetical protein
MMYPEWTKWKQMFVWLGFSFWLKQFRDQHSPFLWRQCAGGERMETSKDTVETRKKV